MSTVSPSTPNLQFYRKQASALLKSARMGQSGALQRISQHALPTKRHSLNSASVALNDAQRAIAREQGFSNWNRFRKFVEVASAGAMDRALKFITAALNDLDEAERILTEYPEVASAGLITALLLGESDRVKRLLKLTPEGLAAQTGPNNWPPLLYVCFSRFASPSSSRRHSLVELGKLLLQNGADPNGSYMPEEWPDNPLPCLYGAIGLNNNPELAASLIDSGAILDDTESVYHSTEHPDLECMRLLLERGANPNSPNVIFHILDSDAPEALRILLDAGADLSAIHPSKKQTPLHWAVWRGRKAEVVDELIKRGVDLNAQQDDGRTAYAMAVVSGQTEVAELLTAAGADTTLQPLDKLVGEMAIAPEAQLTVMTANLPNVSITPGIGKMLVDLAMNHRTGAVRALLSAGVDVDSRRDSGATALHWACWHGYSDTVKLLLSAGASLTIQDEEFHGPPPGWFGHGIHNCPDRSGDWLGVARELITVGAVIPKVDIPTGVPEVDALLREHGYLEP